MQNPYDLLRLPKDAPREAIVRAYHDLLLRHPQEREPQRFAAIERAYRQLTTLEQCMREAFEHPEDTLRALFPAPAMIRDRDAEPETPAPLDAQDLETLLGPWRSHLLRQLLLD